MQERGREPTVTPITKGWCDWVLVDKHGETFPHDVAARRHVSGASELLDGDYCIRHAKQAVEWWREGIEPLI